MIGRVFAGRVLTLFLFPRARGVSTRVVLTFFLSFFRFRSFFSLIFYFFFNYFFSFVPLVLSLAINRSLFSSRARPPLQLRRHLRGSRHPRGNLRPGERVSFDFTRVHTRVHECASRVRRSLSID